MCLLTPEVWTEISKPPDKLEAVVEVEAEACKPSACMAGDLRHA